VAERHTESFTVDGAELLARVRQLIHEGNVRRVSIRQDDHVLLEIPLTAGAAAAAVAVIMAPVLVAVGALAALVTQCTLVVEREGEEPATGDEVPPPPPPPPDGPKSQAGE
jgi:hypothetical protein